MDYDPQRKSSFVSGSPDVCAKFRRNRFKIATVRARTHRQTHTHTERSHKWSYNLSHAMP